MNRNKRLVFFFIPLLLLTLSSQSRAFIGLWFDLGGMAGYTSIAVPEYIQDNDDESAPTIYQMGGSASLGIRFLNSFLFGATSDYRMINQYSEPTKLVGNRRGKRFNLVAPFVGLITDRFLFKFNYQFLGDYVLSNPTAEGITMSYTDPTGFRGTALFRFNPYLASGVFFEYLQFKTQKLIEEIKLADSYNMWQAGISVVVTPFK